MPETPTPTDDPIANRSLLPLYLIFCGLLVVTLLWSLYQEVFGLRPWKSEQAKFKSEYARYLSYVARQQRDVLQQVERDPQYVTLDQAVKSAESKAASDEEEIHKKLALVTQQSLAVTDVFRVGRARVSALTYEWQTTHDKPRLDKEIQQANSELYDVRYPDANGQTIKRQMTFPQVEELFNQFRDQKAQLVEDLGNVGKPVSEATAARDKYLNERMHALSPFVLAPPQIEALRTAAQNLKVDIRQINVAASGLVDRCESCHLGVREPVTILARSKAAPYGVAPEFVSHSDGDLLKIHDPDKFGCSPCHGGNGRATTGVERAHGHYEHWLWPVWARENTEAGCQSCHAADMVIEHGPVISDGKYLYQQRGCVGCHRFAGYDSEPEQLGSIEKLLSQLDQQKENDRVEIERVVALGDKAESNEQAQAYYTKADQLRVATSYIDAKEAEQDSLAHDLMQDRKKVGPDLKEVREKLNPNWIPVWLTKPTDFRPTTKMPNFRLTPNEVKEISAYIWQSGLTDPLTQQPPGNPARGKESFEARGCMACHSIGEGDASVGGDFAANLSRVAEKANYNYLVRWIHDPRERTRPYCPFEKKDIGAADYAKHNLPYVFDVDHSKCPNDGHELLVEQMTVMPRLRLTVEEARDIASYLMMQKRIEPSAYARVDWINDPALKARGLERIKHYGCAGCHEISGLEDEGRIGTELTFEGSKPIERFDFAAKTYEAQRAEPSWYSPKGFIDHKLLKPNIYDEGVKKAPDELLRMPDPHLADAQRVAISTFIQGAVETSFPADYIYRPDDQRRDIQEGWWVVRKYNCMGCHVVTQGQKSVVMGLPRFQSPDMKSQLPPTLMQEGARTNPRWLESFLTNPAMNDADLNRNGVRQYLQIRMPTFYFSHNEVRKLVRFFAAMSYQPIPYMPAPLPALTNQERLMARTLFSSNAAPCLKCHMTGDAGHDRNATAPNFLLARERLKPNWTFRWLLDPSMISPGTAMPSGLFRKEGERNVFAGPVPPQFHSYSGDHADLLVRYMFQITPDEVRQLSARMPKTTASPPAKAEHRAPLPRRQAHAARSTTNRRS